MASRPTSPMFQLFHHPNFCPLHPPPTIYLCTKSRVAMHSSLHQQQVWQKVLATSLGMCYPVQGWIPHQLLLEADPVVPTGMQGRLLIRARGGRSVDVNDLSQFLLVYFSFYSFIVEVCSNSLPWSI